MSDHPILFTGEMLRAIIEGRKTQTRRVIRTRTENRTRIGPVGHQAHIESPEALNHCPYGVPGDLLWVRETVGKMRRPSGGWIYKADQPVDIARAFSWRPSIHMPRAASRLTLRVSNVRVERVQDMSFYDWVADFAPAFIEQERARATGVGAGYQADHSRKLWDTINAKRGYSWDSNPLVWVIEWDKVWTQNVDAVESMGHESREG